MSQEVQILFFEELRRTNTNKSYLCNRIQLFLKLKSKKLVSIFCNLKLASKLLLSPNYSYTELLYKIVLGDIYPMLVTYADKKKVSCGGGGGAA